MLEQHPLESWLSLHASAMARTAAQRQLWERLLASLPPGGLQPDSSSHDKHGGRWGVGSGRDTSGIEEGDEGSSSSSSEDEEEEVVGDSGVGGATGPSLYERQQLSSVSAATDGRSSASSAKAGSGKLGAGAGPAAGVGTNSHGQWEQVMRNVVSGYVLACKDIATAAAADVAAGALLSVVAGKAAGVLLVCKPSRDLAAAHSSWARKEAVANICRLDAASLDVPFERIVPLSMDLSVSNVAVRAAGLVRPLATVGTVTAAGWIIRARQLTAPPTLQQQLFQVGNFHTAPVGTAVKGSRWEYSQASARSTRKGFAAYVFARACVSNCDRPLMR